MTKNSIKIMVYWWIAFWNGAFVTEVSDYWDGITISLIAGIVAPLFAGFLSGFLGYWFNLEEGS